MFVVQQLKKCRSICCQTGVLVYLCFFYRLQSDCSQVGQDATVRASVEKEEVSGGP